MTDTRTHWLSRAPAMLREEGWCSSCEEDPTPMDRRWLWRLESFLALSALHADPRCADLRQYLYETCEHHWHEYAAENGIPAHRQCTWCHDAEFPDDVKVGTS